MKKEFNKRKVQKYKFIKGITLSLVFTASIVFTQQIFTINALAAAVEDCDLDGYDDHTGNPVPWIGFDSTKGEEIPSGWDGHTIYKSKKAFEDEQNKDTETKNTSDVSSESPSSNNSNVNTPGSSTPSSSTPSSSSTDSSSVNSTSDSSQTSATSNSKNKNKNSSSKKSNTNNTTKTTNSSQLNDNEVSNSKENVEETTALNATEVDGKDSKKKDKNKKDILENGIDEAEQVDVQVVLDTKGNLEVNEADGNIIHAGSNLIITGTGFAASVENITIEIHSDNAINLANVNTAEDGSFQSQVHIPEELPEGTHEIILLYQGQQITSQVIEVGPRVADTFFKALTVGFSADNEGLVPGLLILVGLLALGVVTVLLNGLFGKKKIRG